jgi:hypothetical protein
MDENTKDDDRRVAMRTIVGGAVGLAAGTMLAPKTAHARASLTDLESRVVALEAALASFPLGGSVFVRWGSSSAPAGTQLMYSGYACASYYTHTGSMLPIVIQSGMSGSFPNTNGALGYAIHIGESLPGVPMNHMLLGAVCYAPGPTEVIWGVNTAPAGWSTLYRGWAMGPHYTHQGSQGPICVERESFISGGTGGTFNPIYRLELENIPGIPANAGPVPAIVVVRT